MKIADFLKSAFELGRSYLLKPANGYALSAFLVVTYLGLQGIKLASPWINFELTLLGADSGPGAAVVVVVAMALVIAQCLKDRSGPHFLNAFRETLRLRELGFGAHEIESRLFVEPNLFASIYDAAERHSVPIPVRNWSLSKLRSVVGGEEFSSLLVRTVPSLADPVTSVGCFFENWLSDSSFKEQFATIDEITAWITNQNLANGHDAV